MGSTLSEHPWPASAPDAAVEARRLVPLPPRALPASAPGAPPDPASSSPAAKAANVPRGEARAEELLARIVERSARIGVVGLGAVGLPLAAAFLDAGFRVDGYDRDAERVQRLVRGENPLVHLRPGFVRGMRNSGRFEPGCDPRRIALWDVALVSVPTPLDAERQPDLACVRDASELLARGLRPGCLVVLESTTWPGTTREVVGGIFRALGHRPGEDVFLAYSPEREDPGRAGSSTATIPKLVGGTCARSQALAQALYRTAVREVHAVSSAEVAEAAKLFENVYRAVNIGLVNELKLVLERLGIDVWETLEAAGTKPFGFQRFSPGPGTGGPCIPVDPRYYAWIARRAGLRPAIVESADELNRAMPAEVVERTRALLEAEGRELAGARVLVLGIAYKADVDIVAESPALEVLELLESAGARVAYADPCVPRVEHAGRQRASVELDAAELGSAEVVLLLTDHASFDYAAIAARARRIVDTRNAFGRRGLRGAHIRIA